MPSPLWRHFTHILDYIFQLQVRLRRPAPDDTDLRDKFCENPFRHFELAEP